MSNESQTDAKPKRYRVALLKCMEYGFTAVHGVYETDPRFQSEDVSLSGYVRVSDIVEIEFPPLSDDAVVAGVVKALDEKRAELSREFAKKLDEIDRQKADLLALTHQVSA